MVQVFLTDDVQEARHQQIRSIMQIGKRDLQTAATTASGDTSQDDRKLVRDDLKR